MLTPISDIIANKGGDIYAVQSGATAAEAVARMAGRGLGSMLVLDGDQLVGIFTERDLMIRVVHAGLNPAETPVTEVMTRDPQCISAFTTVKTAMEMITEKKFRRLPVMENDRLVGMITIGDLARWLVSAQKHQMEDLVKAVTDVASRGG